MNLVTLAELIGPIVIITGVSLKQMQRRNKLFQRPQSKPAPAFKTEKPKRPQGMSGRQWKRTRKAARRLLKQGDSLGLAQ